MRRILIIEDNAPLAWLLERMLRGQYSIVITNDGLDALLWLSEGHVCDLIISDLHMPAVNGFELLESLKQSGLYREIPVIVLSGMEDSIDKCMALGAFSCVMKPFDPQKLLQQITLALQAGREKELAVY
jgi:two-component system, chemotaxis family, chemotaxis protein CheY